MKRKAFHELMRQAAGNVLINMELNPKAFDMKVGDLTALRGVAYGIAAADVLLNERPLEFDLNFLLVLAKYAEECEDIYAESGAAATISRLYGCEVSIDE